MKEWTFASPPPACQVSPDGPSGIEGTRVMERSVIRQDSSGDLIFMKHTSGTVCVDPVGGTFSASITEEITGGTGRFEGATGSFEAKGTGRSLISDGKGHGFGVLEWTATGTIDTP